MMAPKDHLRSGAGRLPVVFVLALLLFVEGNSQGILTSVDSRSLKGKIDSTNTAPIIVEIADNEYRFNRKALSQADLFAELDAFMDTRMPGERTIYLTADNSSPFDRVVKFLLMGRELDVDDFALFATARAGKFDPAAAVPIKIVLEEPEKTRPKPGPRFLGVELSASGSLSLNGKSVTEIALVASLRRIFDSRKKRRVYVMGSKDVEKTVFVRFPRATTFEELVRVLKVVQSSTASPIALEIDWLS